MASALTIERISELRGGAEATAAAASLPVASPLVDLAAPTVVPVQPEAVDLMPTLRLASSRELQYFQQAHAAVDTSSHRSFSVALTIPYLSLWGAGSYFTVGLQTAVSSDEPQWSEVIPLYSCSDPMAVPPVYRHHHFHGAGNGTGLPGPAGLVRATVDLYNGELVVGIRLLLKP